MAVPDRDERLPQHARRPRSGARVRWICRRPRQRTGRPPLPCPRRPGSNRCPMLAPSHRVATRPTSRSPGRRSASRSWPRSSICRPGSGRCSSCARSCTGGRTRSPSCSAPRSPRSTARCSVRVRRWLRRTISATHHRRRWTTRSERSLDRYVSAFERYDMDALTALLHEDATWNMPPYELWLQTHLDIERWCLGPGIGCRGSRLVPVVANGSPAFGQYKPAPAGGLRALVDPGPRARGRPDQRDHLLPGHRAGSSRSSAYPHGSTSDRETHRTTSARPARSSSSRSLGVRVEHQDVTSQVPRATKRQAREGVRRSRDPAGRWRSCRRRAGRYRPPRGSRGRTHRAPMVSPSRPRPR